MRKRVTAPPCSSLSNNVRGPQRSRAAVSRAIAFIGLDDSPYDRMADDVVLGKLLEGDAFDALECVFRLGQTRPDTRLEIDLRTVAGDDHP